MRKLLLNVILLGAMSMSACQPAPTIVPTQTTTVSVVPPTTTAMPSPVPTSTRDPNLPCGGIMPERVYLFLDCNDVRRIRTQIEIPTSDAGKAWDEFKTMTDTYRTTGFPVTFDPDASYDALWSGGHANYYARDMALIYLVTGDQAYANDVIRLLELVRDNTPYHDHLAQFNGNSHAKGAGSGGLMSHPAYGEGPYQSTLFAYLAIRDSGLIAPEQQSVYDDFFKHQAVLLQEAAVYFGNRTPLDSWVNRNVTIGANVSAATIAVAFPGDPAMVEFHNRVRADVDWQIANWFESDGNWGEDVDGYGYRILEGLLLYAESLQKIRGEDFYQIDFNGRNLNLLCEWYMKVLTPEGADPALNDTPHTYGDPGVFELCASRTGNPSLQFLYERSLWGLSNAFGNRGLKEGSPFNIVAWSGLAHRDSTPPAYTSLAMPDVGVTILRENWETDSQYLLLQFTDSKVHAEKSFGQVYLYDHGPWIVGNGYHLSGESKPAGPTDQHSTLAMDGLDQTNTSGNMLAFADLTRTGISSVTSRSYSNMQHTRTALWMKDLHQWLIVDDASVDGGGRHNLQLAWYVRGFIKSSEGADWVFSRPGTLQLLSIRMLSDLDPVFSRISRSYEWGSAYDDAVGVRMDVKYSRQPVRLVSSLHSFLADDPETIVTRTDSDQGTQIFVQRENAEWLWLLPRQFTDVGAVEDNQIDGKAGCEIRVAGEVQGYCLMLGKSLVMRGQPLVTADAPVYLEVDLAAGRIVLQSESDVTVTLYSPYEVNVLLQDGHPIPLVTMGTPFTIHVMAGRYEFVIQK